MGKIKIPSTRTRLLKRLRKLEPGMIVQYKHFVDLGIAPGTIAVTLSRLHRDGVLHRVAKGSYRLPVKSRFGIVPPSEQQVLKTLLHKSNRKLLGYPTGVTAFNRMGLTTQVAREVEIATSRPGRPKQVGSLRVRFVQSRGELKPNDVPLRQLLDALRKIKRLPDATPAVALVNLREQIEKLSENDKSRLVRLAQEYNPATRALLGALLEKLGENKLALTLHSSLNPLTTYRLGLSEVALPNRDKWRIR